MPVLDVPAVTSTATYVVGMMLARAPRRVVVRYGSAEDGAVPNSPSLTGIRGIAAAWVLLFHVQRVCGTLPGFTWLRGPSAVRMAGTFTADPSLSFACWMPHGEVVLLER